MPGPLQPTRLPARRLGLLAAALLFALALAELGAGYSLWLTDHPASALKTLALRALGNGEEAADDLAPMVTRYKPRSPFAPDPTLGFRLAPGAYTVRIEEAGTPRHHSFHLTLNDGGRRPCSPHPETHAGQPEIWLLGNSWVLGWGNDDHSTLGSFLQRYLPDRKVVCFAAPGYGNLHALLQLRQHLPAGNPPETLVIAYADYFHERNAATQERLATFRAHPEAFPDPVALQAFRHPRARRAGNTLLLDHVPLFPATSTSASPALARPEAFAETDPDLHEQQAITLAILREILSLARQHHCRPILAWLRGAHRDPVPTEARRAGFQVADLRPRADHGEWDDFRPFDPHPGPRAQAAFAAKLRRVLDLPIEP